MKTKQIVITTTINADVKAPVADALCEELATQIIGILQNIQDDNSVINQATVNGEVTKL